MSLRKDKNVYWLENPSLLFRNINIFPSADMSKAEKLNALTILSLIITAVMYCMDYEYWPYFLIISLFVLTSLNYCSISMNKDDNDKDKDDNIIEPFTMVPTYVGQDFHQTTVTPTYAEEWQIPPPAYDLYTNTAPTGECRQTFAQPLKPQSYPYGQYLSRTNLLPSDEYHTHMGCGSAREAREYVNSSFLRNDLAFRDNMTRIYKKKLNRRFRHSGNGNDSFSPFHSY